MRYQGRITDWKDDRGFGFITPNGENDRVFVHVSAFVQRQLRPDVDELVTYELVTDPQKGGHAEEVLYVAPRDVCEAPGQEPVLRQFILVVIAVAVGLYGWEHYQQRLNRFDSKVGRTPAVQNVVSANVVNTNVPSTTTPSNQAVTCQPGNECIRPQ